MYELYAALEYVYLWLKFKFLGIEIYSDINDKYNFVRSDYYYLHFTNKYRFHNIEKELKRSSKEFETRSYGDLTKRIILTDDKGIRRSFLLHLLNYKYPNNILKSFYTDKKLDDPTEKFLWFNVDRNKYSLVRYYLVSNKLIEVHYKSKNGNNNNLIHSFNFNTKRNRND